MIDTTRPDTALWQGLRRREAVDAVQQVLDNHGQHVDAYVVSEIVYALTRDCGEDGITEDFSDAEYHLLQERRRHRIEQARKHFPDETDDALEDRWHILEGHYLLPISSRVTRIATSSDDPRDLLSTARAEYPGETDEQLLTRIQRDERGRWSVRLPTPA